MAISVADTALNMEKRAISCCTRRNTLRTGLVWIYCFIILTSFSTFFVFWCTDIFRNFVLSQLALRNGTNTFALWQRPPVNVTYKVYIFNYTNVNDFESGRARKLHVQELGPYIYHETISRVNVEIHDNDTLTYQEKRSHQWAGGRSINDTVVIPNIPLMSATAYVRDLNFAARLALTTVLTTLQQKTFLSVKAGGFIWGYDDHLFHVAKPLISLTKNIPIDKFGILAMRNGVDKDRITIRTGSQNIDDLGLIERVNGMDRRNVWDDEKCDKIEGTDGSMFAPHSIEDTNKTLYIYSKEICRKLPFRFSEQVTNYDMPSLRYKLSADAFISSATQNECFCTKAGRSRICPPAGIFNVSACAFDSPLLVSFPHFYSADKSLLEQVDGLYPCRERHESYVDLHPRLAIPIAGWSRLQLNLEVRKAIGVPFLGKLKDGAILPLIWVDAGIDDIPKPILKILHMAYFTVSAVETGFQWFSLIIVILSTIALFIHLKKYRMEDVILQRNSSAQNKLLESS